MDYPVNVSDYISLFLIEESGLKLLVRLPQAYYLAISLFLIEESGLKPVQEVVIQLQVDISLFLIEESGLKHLMESDNREIQGDFSLLN